MTPRVPVGDCWGAGCMWQAWGMGAGCVSVCAYAYQHGCMWHMGGTLGCIWRCHKGVHNSTPIDGVYSMGGVWDGIE